MSSIEQLRDTVAKLGHALDVAREALVAESQVDRFVRTPAESVRDEAGRFILLDGLAALATAQAALVTVEHALEQASDRRAVRRMSAPG